MRVRTMCIGLPLFVFALVSSPGSAQAGDAPAWMHALVNVPLPTHDEKTEAVLLYSEDITMVISDSKIKTIERRAYKILRPEGRSYGIAEAEIDSNLKVTSIRGWCIPAQGKDYEVKDKEAVEVSLSGVEFSDLITDQKERLLRIPAAEPGNIIGYEIESEERPLILQGWWHFQEKAPIKEARYILQLPAGWEFKSTWINHAEVAPTSIGGNQWQWVVNDVPGIRGEEDMPPVRGLSGQMLVAILPPGGSGKQGFKKWSDLGIWEAGLVQGRRDASPELKRKVAELTANSPTTLAKMQALAQFLQKEIRYVSIQLGIGGWQPHPANEIFAHKYGDCKDKATLMSAMLKEIGVDSYYLVINVTRGAVSPATPPQPFWFNHMILGIKLPDDVKHPSLVAVYSDPNLGRILIFDPTDEMTPLGQLRGDLQANYGLLVAGDGGELIRSPELSPTINGIHRSGKFQLSPNGRLTGDVVEVLYGDSAMHHRYMLRSVSKDSDRIKYVESLLSHSLGTYQVNKAQVGNLSVNDLPLQYLYSLTADSYAKSAGDLFLVRPRVLGNKSSDLLEKKEPRKYPVEFDGPEKDADNFEITLPAGYVVDELPPPVNSDYSFASYHSKTEMDGNVLRYTRTFEIKEVSVPVEKVDDLKKFYRVIASDERNIAMLKQKVN
jgi:transglutaminase-like putative cysteine protease